MNRIFRAALLLCALATCPTAFAQVRVQYQDATTGAPVNVTTSTPLPVTSSGGGGGSDGVAQASTTSGQSGVLMQCASTTSAPTYVSATTNPCSTNLAGAVRVDGSGVTQPVSGTIAVSGTVPVSIAANVNVVGTKLNDGSQSSTGGTHLTMGGVDTGTNVYRPVLVDSTGRPVVVGAGTAGTTAGGVLSVQGVSGGVYLNVNAAGAVASGGGIATAPVRIAGAFNTTQPTVTNAQTVDWQMTSRGEGIVSLGNSGVIASMAGNNADGVTVSSSGSRLVVNAGAYIYNGTALDRMRTVINATNSSGTGILAAGLLAQLDDTTPTTITENSFGNLRMSQNRALLVKLNSGDGDDWSYAAASGGISNTTTAVTIKAAAGAGLRNYVTACTLDAETLGAATEVALRDGAAGTVLGRWYVGTSGTSRSLAFPTPLRGTANTLLEVVTLTATVSGGVRVNCQGYVAP